MGKMSRPVIIEMVRKICKTIQFCNMEVTLLWHECYLSDRWVHVTQRNPIHTGQTRVN